MNTVSAGNRFLGWVFLCISLFMAGVAVWASLKESLFEVFFSLLRQPWVAATLIDFYFNIFILSVWVFYKEKNKAAAFAWALLFVALGSIATAFYVFIQFRKLRPGEGINMVLLKR